MRRLLPTLLAFGCGRHIEGLDPLAWDAVVVNDVGDAQVLDARSPAAWAAGHVQGAASLHWRELMGRGEDGLWGPLPRETLAALLGARGIRDDRPIVIYGEGPDGGGDDGNVYWALRWLDHPDVRVLNGGMLGWVADGHTPTLSPAPSPTTYIAGHDPSVLATTADVADWDGPIIDVRSAEEYDAGHIPGAVWREWTDVYSGFSVAAEDEVADVWAEVGAVPGSHPVVYCEAGIRAGHSFMMLDAMGIPAANYAGSWSRWTAEDMPIAR